MLHRVTDAGCSLWEISRNEAFSPLFWKLKGKLNTRYSSLVGSTIEYTSSVHTMASPKHGLFLAKQAAMALQTTLKGCLVRVDAYGNINWKSPLGLFSCFTAP